MARKSHIIGVRVTPLQKAALEAAANRAGLDTSSWLRSLGLREAKKTAVSTLEESHLILRRIQQAIRPLSTEEAREVLVSVLLRPRR